MPIVITENYGVGDYIETDEGRRGRFAGGFWVGLVEWDGENGSKEEGAIFRGDECLIRIGLPIAIKEVMEIDRKNLLQLGTVIQLAGEL